MCLPSLYSDARIVVRDPSERRCRRSGLNVADQLLFRVLVRVRFFPGNPDFGGRAWMVEGTRRRTVGLATTIGSVVDEAPLSVCATGMLEPCPPIGMAANDSMQLLSRALAGCIICGRHLVADVLCLGRLQQHFRYGMLWFRKRSSTTTRC